LQRFRLPSIKLHLLEYFVCLPTYIECRRALLNWSGALFVFVFGICVTHHCKRKDRCV
jgi:hypothetical protein